jgi:hypothetical protein
MELKGKLNLTDDMPALTPYQVPDLIAQERLV